MITSQHPSLDIHYYSTYSTPLVFDITVIQCLVSRIRISDNEWAIIDRSGSLAQAIYEVEDEEDD